MLTEQPGIFNTFLYQHPFEAIAIVLTILILLLTYLGIRIWKRERVIGTYRLVAVAVGYLIFVTPILMCHYNEAAQYYNLLKQMGLL